MYLALIASVLLPMVTGRRPDKRLLELIQMYPLGWASLAELEAGVAGRRRGKNPSKKPTGDCGAVSLEAEPCP